MLRMLTEPTTFPLNWIQKMSFLLIKTFTHPIVVWLQEQWKMRPTIIIQLKRPQFLNIITQLKLQLCKQMRSCQLIALRNALKTPNYCLVQPSKRWTKREGSWHNRSEDSTNCLEPTVWWTESQPSKRLKRKWFLLQNFYWFFVF